MIHLALSAVSVPAARFRDLPGIDADYEPPVAADVIAPGGLDHESLARIIALLQPD